MALPLRHVTYKSNKSGSSLIQLLSHLPRSSQIIPSYLPISSYTVNLQEPVYVLCMCRNI